LNFIPRNCFAQHGLKLTCFVTAQQYRNQNYLRHSGPVHTTQEEFENGGFTLKTPQMFSVHTTPEEFKNATITGHFGFVFEENSVREIT